MAANGQGLVRQLRLLSPFALTVGTLLEREVFEGVKALLHSAAEVRPIEDISIVQSPSRKVQHWGTFAP
jgi:hypothetical protein